MRKRHALRRRQGSGGSEPGVVVRGRVTLDVAQLDQAVAVTDKRQERDHQGVHHHVGMGGRSQEQRRGEHHREQEQHVGAPPTNLRAATDRPLQMNLSMRLIEVRSGRPGLAMAAAIRRRGCRSVTSGGGNNRQRPVRLARSTCGSGASQGRLRKWPGDRPHRRHSTGGHRALKAGQLATEVRDGATRPVVGAIS